MSDFIVAARDLRKVYRRGKNVETVALGGVTLAIPRGAMCAIVGESGHGKSTLLQMMGGLDRPTGGSVAVDGTDLAQLGDGELSEIRATKIGFVFQHFNLLENLTAAENVMAAMMFARPAKNRERKEKARGLLETVGLGDRAAFKPGELSGGQAQRAAVARALANDPPLLLMDEPTGNLDSKSESEVMEYVSRIHAGGKTVVIVTHNKEIAAMAGLVFEMKDGLLVGAASASGAEKRFSFPRLA